MTDQFTYPEKKVLIELLSYHLKDGFDHHFGSTRAKTADGLLRNRPDLADRRSSRRDGYGNRTGLYRLTPEGVEIARAYMEAEARGERI